jgi:Mn-dependent DtxR family transcriptional regulator
MSYDHRCYDLANDFVADEAGLTDEEADALAHKIAELVQRAIEDELSLARDERAAQAQPQHDDKE